MPVERLHVKSLKKFPEVNVHFNSRFNFITGPNGCGKTSLLAAIAHCLAWNGVYSIPGIRMTANIGLMLVRKI
ncbi:hypothetical protein ENINMM100B1_18970 [Enterobacter intestinihominis]|uniref:AAA family ATPase n=1 Tax=Enterobacter hormaechei TaxID=158836 RepID=UPI002FD5B643